MKIGETFAAELRAAGVNFSITWDENGLLVADALTEDQRAKVQAVLGAHDADAKEKRRVGEFREFMDLFTNDEQVALATAALSDVRVKLWYDKAMGGASFSLDNPQTNVGVGFMVHMELLTEARAAEILGADFDA